MDSSVFPDYAWFPSEVLKVSKSAEFLGNLTFYVSSVHRDTDAGMVRDFIRHGLLENFLGVEDPDESTVDHFFSSSTNKRAILNAITELVSKKAEVSWSTHGHTAVDVNLYAYGFASELLRGHHQNNDIGVFIANLLGLDLSHVTGLLKDRYWTLATGGHRSSLT